MSSQEMKPRTGWVAGNSSTGRGRGRRNEKKQPQRGLGVEQLERLRMEETLKKAAEASGIPTLHDHHDQQHHQLLQFQYPSNIPVRYGVPSSSNGFQFPPQMINNNNSTSGSGGLIGFNAWFVANQQHNRFVPYGSGPLLCATPLLVRNNNPFQNSKDLSSMPNPHSHQSFDLCLKKTRLNEDLRRDSWSDVHNFMGLMPQPAAVTPNLDECAEIVAIHRRGNSASTKRAFMEYEFFPRKDELEFPTIGSVVAYDDNEAAAVSVSSSSSSHSTIDLSLKL